MLKGRSLKSCVVLVVFCFFLLLVCISPASAETTSGDPDSFAVYCAYSGSSTPASFLSNSMVVPFLSQHVFCALGSTDGVAYHVWPNCSISSVIAVNYDRTLLLNLGIQGRSVSPTVDSLGPTAVTWYAESYKSNILSGGCWSSYDDMIDVSGKQFNFKITIPATATSLSCNMPVEFSYTGNGQNVGLSSFAGYVIDSADHGVVNLVESILSELQKINGNLTSGLSTLNQILEQCRAIKADTSTIISVLGLCKDQLVTLNGKVDDIYTLLKDSLASESGAVDKKSEELAGQIMQRVDSEQYWSDKNTENFNALDMGNWTFGDGVVGALPTVGNLFKSLWDSIGDATLIFIFPLMLGIALVIVGRVSRTAGKGAKKGGGDDG